MVRNSASPFVSDGARLNSYLEDIRRLPMLVPQEEFALAKRWREHGDRGAGHKLVNNHLRLVAKIAMGYRGYGLPISDIISEGIANAGFSKRGASLTSQYHWRSSLPNSACPASASATSRYAPSRRYRRPLWAISSQWKSPAGSRNRVCDLRPYLTLALGRGHNAAPHTPRLTARFGEWVGLRGAGCFF
jgi:hypothetical protein